MKQGELLKKLRKERNVSQSALVKGISVRSTLASFETRNTQLSSELLFAYLDRLNISPNEFQTLLHDGKTTDKQRLSIECQKRHYEQTITDEFLQSILVEYQQTDDIFYLLHYVQASLENKRQEADFNSDEFKKQQQIVQDYLFRIETWGRFEFSLFINLLFVFDEEMMALNIQNILEKFMVHSEDYLSSNMISVAILNSCHYAVLKRNPVLLQKILLVLEKLPTTSNYFYMKSHSAYYHIFHQYFLTNQFDQSHADQVINLFKMIGYETHAERLHSLIEKIIIAK